jgi:phage recombination protein Bet
VAIFKKERPPSPQPEEKALTVAEPKDVVTQEAIEKYIMAMMPEAGLSDAEKEAFLYVAQEMNLNPWKREIYCVPYNTKVRDQNGNERIVRKLSLITGYEVYIKRAWKTGRLVSWHAETFYSPESSTSLEALYARIEINIKGWPEPFKWECKYTEYDQRNVFWKYKPKTMIKKVCIGQGFRLAFEELQGMPYTAEEEAVIRAEAQVIDDEPKEVKEITTDGKAHISSKPPAEERVAEDTEGDKEITTAAEEGFELGDLGGEQNNVEQDSGEALGESEQPKEELVSFPDVIDRINNPTKYGLAIPVMHKPLIMAQANGIKRGDSPMTFVELIKKIEEHYNEQSGNGAKITF